MREPMNASFMIAQVETTMSNYTDQFHRSGMRDIAIWQSLESIYSRPEEYDLVLTSTREEAFDRMVKDNWHVDMGDHFFGLDYEVIDELVLDYIKDNQLATDTTEEEE
jgi:hypothetical protein